MTFKQPEPKITGYRQLSSTELALINEAKALSQQCSDLVAKLRTLPVTPAGGAPYAHCVGNEIFPSVDPRWISIGATDLQTGFMALVRGIAQPSTF